jgi:hypothetical protein
VSSMYYRQFLKFCNCQEQNYSIKSPLVGTVKCLVTSIQYCRCGYKPAKSDLPGIHFRSSSSDIDTIYAHHLRCTVYTGKGYSDVDIFKTVKEGHGSVKKGI